MNNLLNRTYVISKTWVSASSISNYLLDDPILDYMKITNKKNKQNFSSNINNINFVQILKDQGIQFEKAVIRLLKIPNQNFKQIQYNRNDVFNNNKYIETINAMKIGVPFIYQAILHSKKHKLYGSADLLVRNDYIEYICKNIKEPIPNAPNINFLNSSKNYYYIVIDIKSSTLNLRSNGNTLLNKGRTVASKGQIYIYHKMVSEIQNFNSGIAFILGRKYKYTKMNKKYSGNGWFDRLGSINFNKIDNFIINKVDEAILWRRKVQTEHDKMIVYPSNFESKIVEDASDADIFKPSRIKLRDDLYIDLYPNMCNKLDDNFHNKKRKLADFLGEHTLIGWVGIKHRKIAHSNNIFRFDDPKCTINTLGITGNKRRKTIHTLLKMNQTTNNSKISESTCNPKVLEAWKEFCLSKNFIPKKIITNIYNWRNINSIEAYVDFETVPCSLLENYLFKNVPTTNLEGQRIFLIGIWYKNSISDNWEYKKFISDNLDIKGESKIIFDFTNFIKDNKFTKLYHWGKSAEPYMYQNAYNRYIKVLTQDRNFESKIVEDDISEILDSKFRAKEAQRARVRDGSFVSSLNKNIWKDMCTLFKEGNVGIRGVKTYGLKDVANHMFLHNLIPEIWDSNNSNCINGTNAIVNAYQINKNMQTDPRMNDIIKYNKIDCKILYDIMKYIRNNH